MTDREAFKAGMLLKFAQAGMTADQMLAAITKIRVKAADLSSIVTAPWNAGWNTASNLASQTPAMALALLAGGGLAAIGAGAGAGYLGAQIGDYDDDSPELLKKRELAEEYRRQAEQARLRLKSQQRIDEAGHSGRRVM